MIQQNGATALFLYPNLIGKAGGAKPGKTESSTYKTSPQGTHTIFEGTNTRNYHLEQSLQEISFIEKLMKY